LTGHLRSLLRPLAGALLLLVAGARAEAQFTPPVASSGAGAASAGQRTSTTLHLGTARSGFVPPPPAPAWAGRVCLQGNPLCPPPDVTITPGGGTFTTAAQSVTVDWCGHAPLGFRQILLNGVDITSSFSYTVSAKSGCSSHASSTGTITLTVGSNTLYASVDDNLDQVGSSSAPYTFSPPPQMAVTPAAGALSVATGQAGTATFTVQNTGQRSTSVALTAVCSPALAASPCAPSATSVSLASGAAATVTVSLQGSSASGAGQVALTAGNMAGPEYWSGAKAVTVTPPALAIAPVDAGTLQLQTNQSGSTSFTVQNTTSGTVSVALTAVCTPALAASPCTPSPTSLTLGPSGSATVSLAVVGASSPANSVVTLTAGNMSGPEYWHGTRAVNVTAAPPPVTATFDVPSFRGGMTIERSLCPTLGIVADVAAQCGALRITHALPAATVYGKRYAPTLAYFSDQIIGPSLLVNVTFPAALPDSVMVNVFAVDASGNEAGLVRQTRYSGAAWAANRTQRVNTGPLWPTSGSAGTALYTFDVEVRGFANGGWLTAAPVARGTVANVERLAGPFGNGWWMLGLEELYTQLDGSMLWVGGDGSTRRYVSAATVGDTTAFVAPRVSRPDTLYRSNSSGWWRRALPAHGSVYFDPQGRHRETRNRVGRSTLFTYQDVVGTRGRLTGITLPGALSYSFTYGTSTLTVTAPGGRVTQINRSAAGNGLGIANIVDPDLSSVSFGYYAWAPAAAINSRTDRRQVPTTFTWANSAAMLAGATTPNGPAGNVVQTIRSPRGSGLSTAGDPPVLAGDPDYVFDGPRTDVVDVTKIWVDTLGAPSRITDAAGRNTTLTRDAVFQGLVKTVVQHNGFEQRATYDARGNLATTLAVNPWGDGRDAPTTYTWDQTWDALTSVTLPEGEKTTFGVDPWDGNRIWQQDKRGPSNRAIFAYYYDAPRVGLVRTATIPDRYPTSGGLSDVTYDYDALGNMRSSLTTSGIKHLVGRDAIGRTTADSTQIQKGSTAYWQVATTEYDAADNVKRTVVAGSTALANSLKTQETRRFYDPEGNLDSLQTGPWNGRNGFLARRWTYDAFGRARTEAVEKDGQVGQWIADSSWYDLAGNAVTVKTRNGNVVQKQYDALNRLTTTSTPAVTYGQELLGMASGATTFLDPVELHTPYPYYPSAGTSGYMVGADVATLAYDPATGGVTDANNSYAKVHRTYFPNGQLRGDTLKIRTWAGDGSEASFSHVYGTAATYDRNGRRVALQYPGLLSPSGAATTASFGYDTTGALASVTDLEGRVSTFQYNFRDELVQHVVPAPIVPLVEQWHYDGEGLLDQWGARAQNSAIFNLRNQSFGYDARGKQIAQTDSLIAPLATLANDYDGIGQLTRAVTRIPGTTTQTLYGTDGLGNVTGVKGIEGTTYNNGGFSSSSTDTTGKKFDPVSGRLVLSYDAGLMSGDSTAGVKPFVTRYDLSGNVIWSGRFGYSYTQTQNESRSYYGADNQLRAVDARSWGGRFSQAATFTFEEYRYDALGRRIVVRARRSCEGMTDGTPQHYPRVDCNVSTIRRTIWDGSAELGEIQMPGVEGTDLERETMPPESGAGTPPVNTNPFFGRVAYTYGLGVDQPVAITRLNYSTVVPVSGGGWTVAFVSPFTVYPLWNTKGQSDLVAHTASVPACNNGQVLPGAAPATTCVRFDVGDNYWLAYLRQIGSRGGWQGSLLDDKQDASGMMYRRNRYYDPMAGRFTQEDPIGVAGGVNLYGFAGGDPVNYSDPFGLCPMCIGAATGVAMGYGIAWLTGSDYTWKDAAVDAALGAAGAGLAGKLGKLGRVAFAAEEAAEAGGSVATSELRATHSVGKKAVARLAADIEENGMKEPLKYVEHQGEKHVVDGNHRLQAARKLGIKQVPAERVELPYKGYKTPGDLTFTPRD
jgi:RHS repeat-associated protein